jgi:hypothetical protein
METAVDMNASFGFWVKQTMASGDEVDVRVFYSAAVGQAVDVSPNQSHADSDGQKKSGCGTD